MGRDDGMTCRPTNEQVAMNPVMIDWLTVILAPISLVLLISAQVRIRSARRVGAPVSTWIRAQHGIGIACVMIVALLHV